MSFNFITAVTICSDFGAPPQIKKKKKSVTVSIVSPSMSHEVMRLDAMSKVRETQVWWQLLQEGIRGQTHRNHTHRNLVNLITLGPQPCLTQCNQAMPVGQPKTGGSWWRGLTECGPLEKGMASHFSILALRTP